MIVAPAPRMGLSHYQTLRDSPARVLFSDPSEFPELSFPEAGARILGSARFNDVLLPLPELDGAGCNISGGRSRGRSRPFVPVASPDAAPQAHLVQ